MPGLKRLCVCIADFPPIPAFIYKNAINITHTPGKNHGRLQTGTVGDLGSQASAFQPNQAMSLGAWRGLTLVIRCVKAAAFPGNGTVFWTGVSIYEMSF